ncbi:MAG: hypothetical protein LUG18_11320 [Candidatus Azobacteroides sp.]|nr:hypothetical protein [Candidatus Azobacteroides sp.]
MNRSKTFVFFVFAMLTTFLHAKLPQEKQYIYLPYEYSFCVENANISIHIPEGWGFYIPSLNENSESRLLIQSGMVVYNSYSDSVSKINSVFFITPDAKEPCLELRTAAFGSAQIDEHTISSDLGNFYRVDQIEEEKVESYQMIVDSQVITFRILQQEEADKKRCLDIISSATSAYNAYLNAYDKRDGMERHSIRYYAKDSTNYPDLGFTFITPFDMSAEIKAPQIKIHDPSTLLSAYVTLDEISEEEYAAYFWENDFNMKYTFKKNGTDKATLQHTINSFTGIYYYKDECQHTFTYPVSGIPATVHVLGNRALPTITVSIPTKEYHAIFLFENVSEKEIDAISTILSQIHIDDAQKQEVSRLYPSSTFSELVNIQPLNSMMTHTEIKLNKSASLKNVSFIECHIPDAKAVIQIPALETVYAYPSYDIPQINDKKNKYKVTLRKDALSSSDKEDFNGAVMTYDNSGYNQIVLWLPENKEKISAEEFFLKQYIPYECQVEDGRVKRAGIAKIKNQKWYVLTIDELDYTYHQYITEINDILIELRVITTSEEERDIEKITETLLYKAEIK